LAMRIDGRARLRCVTVDGARAIDRSPFIAFEGTLDDVVPPLRPMLEAIEPADERER
jgi:hypothetical protein